MTDEIEAEYDYDNENDDESNELDLCCKSDKIYIQLYTEQLIDCTTEGWTRSQSYTETLLEIPVLIKEMQELWKVWNESIHITYMKYLRNFDTFKSIY